jgi:hypothetical protein
VSETPDRPSGSTAEAIPADPSASVPLKAVVRDWATRDVVDAANDAAVLQAVCHGAVRSALGLRP